jgi:hypothetical protein
VRQALTRAHGVSFATLLAVFTGLTLLITYFGVDGGPRRAKSIALTTLSTITGPLTGAISRGAVGSKGCCFETSRLFMARCGPVLLAGIAVQWVAWPPRPWAQRTRLLLWIAGWFTWFAGGSLSLGHSLAVLSSGRPLRHGLLSLLNALSKSTQCHECDEYPCLPADPCLDPA